MKRLSAAALALIMILSAFLAGCNGSTSGSEPSGTSSAASTPSQSAEPSGSQPSESAPSQPAGPKTVTMAVTSAWDTFIPFNTTNAYTDAVLELMFDKLIVVKADGSFGPRLADSWSMSADNTSITFQLNPNAKWHDGTPVTAADIVFTGEIMAHPDLTVARRSKIAPFAGTADGIRVEGEEFGVKAIDEHTVEFTMREPNVMDYMLSVIFRDFYILPKHLLEDVAIADFMAADFWQKPVGSGPCVYESMISGERVEFAANKEYHVQTPDFDRFVVKVVAPSSLLASLINGEIDICGLAYIPLNDWDMAQQTAGIHAESVPGQGYTIMTINVNNIPQPVRQAVDIAINRDVIVQNLMRGEGLPAAGPVLQTNRYFNQALLPIEYDVEKAKQMVADSGFDTSKEYSLLVYTGNDVLEKSAALIQQDLDKIGVKVKIVTSDVATLLTNARAGDYDFALIGMGGGTDPSVTPMNVTPGHVNNFSQIADNTLGDLGKAGLKAFTFEERKPIYDEYQVKIKEIVPFAFLYFENKLFAWNERISNVSPANFELLNRSVWEWKVD